MTNMTNNIMPNNAMKFHCKKCNFKCSKESNWKLHILTNKHIQRTNTNTALKKNANNYECKCGKIYKHVSSLWNHKQK